MGMQYHFILFFLFFSCQAPREKTGSYCKAPSNQYAHGFSVTRIAQGYKLIARNPWENAKNIELSYYLIDKQVRIPDSLKNRTIIKTPVERIICLSTSHLAYLDLLNELDKVTGISGSHYISNAYVNKRIQEGIINDVGYGSNLNYEEIIRQKPDLVLVYGVGGEISGYLEKFRDLGIPAVIMAEYLEDTPLGKAEWLKFIARFFNKEKLADSLFLKVEGRYQQLVGLTSELKMKPGVMVGLPYRDSWWIPGGQSYLARLIADAGGHFLAGDNTSHESYVISMEDAIQLFSGAEIWINTGMVTRKSGILAMDKRFEKLPFFRNARIYNNNNRFTPAGGMDFWESGTVQPDVILGDLIRIFHPGLLPHDTLFYYCEIK
jgi:iron complex transport system substrate-binding protein